MRRICCLPGSEPAPQVWVFLAPRRFATKILILSYWISLDSLVRIEAFQWVARDKSVIFFCGRFRRCIGIFAREIAVLTCKRARSVIAIFLISRNNLSLEPSSFSRAIETRSEE